MVSLRRRLLLSATVGAIVLASSGCALLVGPTASGVPSGTPTDLPSIVPVYPGEVLSSAVTGDTGARVWTIHVRIPGSAAMADIEKELTDLHFAWRETVPITSKAGTILAARNTVGVTVRQTTDADGHIATYTVTE